MPNLKGYLFLPILMSPSVLFADVSVKVGATLPLSGNLATYGNLIKGGLELAKEDLKKEGINLDLVFEDTPLAGQGVMTSINKLVYQDKVNAIAGNFSNPAMLAMGHIIEKEKIPAFHTAASDPGIVDFPRYVFSTNIRIRDEAYHLADYIYNRANFKTAAVMTVLTNFGEAYRNYFVERYIDIGGRIVGEESFQIGDLDYKTQLIKLKAKKPEVIFGACFGNFLGQMIKQSRDMGIDVPIYSVYETEDESVIDSGQGRTEGVRYFVTTSESKNERFKSFRERFMGKYQREPGTFSSNAYDAAMILGHSFKDCKMDKECVVEKIYEVKNYPGVSGDFSIGRDGIASKEFILKEIKGKGFIEVE